MSVTNYMHAARDEGFAARVAFILMKSCVNIANEADTVPNHGPRLALAQRHFKAEINTKAMATAIIATNTTIQTTIDSSPGQRGSNVSDGDLEFVINSLIDNFAAAYSAGV